MVGSRRYDSIDSWTELPSEQLHTWNQQLLQTDASFYQYPYWNEPRRKPYFSPRYLVYGSLDRPTAYVCVLTIGIAGVFIGLVEHGPVSLVADSTNRMSALHELVRWAKRHGYIFLRFSDSDHQFIESILSGGPAKRVDAFPFHRGRGDDLIVEQLQDDDQMLASFNATARYEIRRAQRLGYTLEVTDSPERFAEFWPLFEAHAIQKGFHRGPLLWSLDLIRFGRRHGCVRIYAAHRDNQLVQVILVIRDRTTAYYIVGALDVEALERKSSDSPSCFLHWLAMRDFYRLGVKYYSLGGGSAKWRQSVFYQFKRKFNPVEKVYPPPVTIVTNWMLYHVWSSLGLCVMLTWWPRIRPIVRRLISNRRGSVPVG